MYVPPYPSTGNSRTGMSHFFVFPPPPVLMGLPRPMEAGAFRYAMSQRNYLSLNLVDGGRYGGRCCSKTTNGVGVVRCTADMRSKKICDNPAPQFPSTDRRMAITRYSPAPSSRRLVPWGAPGSALSSSEICSEAFACDLQYEQSEAKPRNPHTQCLGGNAKQSLRS